MSQEGPSKTAPPLKFMTVTVWPWVVDNYKKQLRVADTNFCDIYTVFITDNRLFINKSEQRYPNEDLAVHRQPPCSIMVPHGQQIVMFGKNICLDLRSGLEYGSNLDLRGR
ncbi:hypothetical protein AX14_010982 [Amanita brunnescens Koide BX004]|nr:hypothetical protein AX14_010982 [Amanita brunnescens Koide BX004]